MKLKYNYQNAQVVKIITYGGKFSSLVPEIYPTTISFRFTYRR